MNKPKATEGCRVAQEIAVIRAALTKRGYRVHKRPKQAVWKVFTPFNPRLAKGKTGEYYLLTYQPAPISAWILHPQNNSADYQTIETIIQRAIKKQSVNLTKKVS